MRQRRWAPTSRRPPSPPIYVQRQSKPLASTRIYFVSPLTWVSFFGPGDPTGMVSSASLPPPPPCSQWYVHVCQKSNKKQGPFSLFFTATERGTRGAPLHPCGYAVLTSNFSMWSPGQSGPFSWCFASVFFSWLSTATLLRPLCTLCSLKGTTHSCGSRHPGPARAGDGV